MPVDFADLGIDITGNWTDKYVFQASPTSAELQCTGLYGIDCDSNLGPLPEFSLNARATAGSGPHQFSVLWRWIDGLNYEDPSDASVLDDYKSIDATSYIDLAYRFEFMETAALTVGVQNLFDKKPPIVSSYIGATAYNSGNTYPVTYDALGRRYTATVSVSF